MGKWALFAPVNILASTIIGAGMFALPYLFARAGVLAGTAYLVIFGFAFCIVHLMYADILRREDSKLIFPGIARKYLGRGGEYLAYVVGVFALLLALTSYIILEMQFLRLVLPGVPTLYSFIFFWGTGTLAFMLWRSVKLGYLEAITNAAAIFIIGALIAFAFRDGVSVAPPALFSFKDMFLPYSIVLFSLAGRTAIPVVLAHMRGAPAPRISLAILLGTTIPIAVYLLFILGVLLVSPLPTEDAISGMIGVLPPHIVSLFGILGILSLWSSYIIIGKAVRDSFSRDMKIGYPAANTIAAVMPVVLYLMGFQNFIKTIGVVGGIFLALESILIVLMWKRASKKTSPRALIKRIHPMVLAVLFLIFFGGILHELIAR